MASEERGEWVDAGGVDGYTVGQPALLRHGDRRLAVVRSDDGEIYVIDDRCPHEGYPLTQGTVAGCELTCCWHNFKFDLRTGGCARGEAVQTFKTRQHGERLWVFVEESDPAVEQAKAWASLAEGLWERRDGQIARDVVRLLRAGATPAAIAMAGAVYDAERGPDGSGHALPVALDVLPLCERYPGPAAVRPLMQLMEMVAEGNVRRPPRRVVDAIDPGADGAAAEARFRAAVEGERLDEAEGLLRGALARGFGRAELQPWFIGACCDHFLNFGHGLIYSTKVFDLLDAAGWESAPSLLVGLLHDIVTGTREDSLPPWGWWRKAMQGYQPKFAEWHRLSDATACLDVTAGPDEALVEALLGSKREAALGAVAERFERGVAAGVIVDSLVTAAAERLRRFDVAHDADETVQDGWLDVTHTFTFAHAVRSALAWHARPEALALVFQAARFIQNAGALDRAETAPVGMAESASLDALRAAIAARDADRAEALVRRLAEDGEQVAEIAQLRVFFEDLPLYDAFVRPIVVAHAIKTTRAAFDEHARRPGDVRPLVALARFVASPVRQRFIGERAHEAVRFIVDGKVPRVLT